MSNEAIRADLEASLSAPFPSSANEAASRIIDALDSSIEVYKTTNQSLNDSMEAIVWENIRIKDTGYVFNSGGSEIKIPAGRYRIFLRLTIRHTLSASSDLSSSKIEIQENSSSSFEQISGSAAYGHHGVAPEDYFTLISVCTFVAPSPTALRAVAKRLGGLGNLKIEANGSNLLIKRL